MTTLARKINPKEAKNSDLVKVVFDKNHKAIDLIRKKQYIFTKKFTDNEVLSETFLNEISTAFKAIRPYFNYMSDVLTTDLNGVSLI